MADWSASGRRRISANGSRSHLRSLLKNGDFEEEDVVWSAANKETEDFSKTTPRQIPRSSQHHHQHHYSQTNEVKTPRQSSAPVSIPDWSKIYGKGKMTSSRDGTDGVGDGESCGGGGGDYEDDEEEEDEGMVPPHEWIARKLARAQISSNSMFEGIGRTLKGRDLSKVRNAILSKTGFLE